MSKVEGVRGQQNLLDFHGYVEAFSRGEGLGGGRVIKAIRLRIHDGLGSVKSG